MVLIYAEETPHKSEPTIVEKIKHLPDKDQVEVIADILIFWYFVELAFPLCDIINSSA